MAAFLSAGTATIAALMIADRGEGGAPPAAQAGAGWDSEAAPGRCRRAVTAAWQDLQGFGREPEGALLVCASLYRTHHPEAPAHAAQALVAAWIRESASDDELAGCGCGVAREI